MSITTHRNEYIEDVVRRTWQGDAEELDEEVKLTQQAYAIGAPLFIARRRATEEEAWQSFHSNILQLALDDPHNAIWNRISRGECVEEEED